MRSMPASCWRSDAGLGTVPLVVGDGGGRIPRRADHAVARHAGARRRPPGAVGRTFGIVTTGFSIGGMVGPLMFGYIMDHGAPRWVFGVSVIVMIAVARGGLVGDRRVAAKRRKRAGRLEAVAAE